MKIVWFCHGKESGPAGTKIQRLGRIASRHGWLVRAIDFRGVDGPDERVAMLLTAWREEPPHRAVLVGSSMGGYVAAVASQIIVPEALLLMAPAVGIAHYPETAPDVKADRTLIVHGWDDDVVPPDNVLIYARSKRLPLRMVAAGHDLSESLAELETDFDALLKSLSNNNSILPVL